MKRLLTYCLMLITVSAMAQEKVQFGKDQCAFCGMTIRDHLHAALAVDNQGTTYKFDAAEGLINFLKEHNEADFKTLLVADYAHKDEWADAPAATFLISKKIASPMGAFLSAFADKADAEKVLKKKGGAIYNWEEIKRKFKDSRFGLSDHRHDHHRPDGQAPIGVMGDHLHPKGGIMGSFRYMRMDMDDYLQSSQSIESAQVLSNYMVAPQNMTMDMYMLGLMYAPSYRVTLMLMQNYVQNEMDLVSRMGMNFSTRSAGLGDMKLSALIGLSEWNNKSLHLNTGVSIPLGSVAERGATPMGDNMKMPYPMQLGSGTYDLILGATFQGKAAKHSWGIQQINTLRSGRNSEGYRLGSEFKANAWIAYRLFQNVSFSFRLEGTKLNGIHGIDPELNPMMVPTANINNSGFERLRSYVGANIAMAQSGWLENFKLGVEVGTPIVNKVQGMQMDENYLVQVGLRYSH
ncbi:MAG: transporter [Roseivirga sp.]|nr:transporter [Roseivirga sp.]